MKIGLVIATYRRPEILEPTLRHLMSQPTIPNKIIISAVVPDDVPAAFRQNPDVQLLFGSAGSCAQRNRGISLLLDEVDIIAFIDDDFIVGDNYFDNLASIFERDASVVGLEGKAVADGAGSKGFTFDEGLGLTKQYSARQAPPRIRDIRGTHGCSMAFRSASIGSLRFDERMCLYGWQEDLDFSGALRRCGRVVGTNIVWGVHLGTMRGKSSGLRFGYSQIINPAYIVLKGNMSCMFAFQLAARNFLTNAVKSLRPESYVDRRGRLRGNLIGIKHLITGRVTPEYIAELD
jgi:GT2 family glycosyltransferase